MSASAQEGRLQISHSATNNHEDILTPDVDHMTIFWFEIAGTMTLHCKDSNAVVEIVVAGQNNVTCGAPVIA